MLHTQLASMQSARACVPAFYKIAHAYPRKINSVGIGGPCYELRASQWCRDGVFGSGGDAQHLVYTNGPAQPTIGASPGIKPEAAGQNQLQTTSSRLTYI